MLKSGASSVDAVEQVLRSLEDNGTFDAGTGSHLNALGQIELDASIMNGSTFRCGAVAAVGRVRNPISLARKIMDESEHILLVGPGAERFAQDHGIPLCLPEELISSREMEHWKSTPSHGTAKDAGWERLNACGYALFELTLAEITIIEESTKYGSLLIRSYCLYPSVLYNGGTS